MDWAVDAAIPHGTYSLENLWNGEQLGPVVVGGEVWEAAQWKGILAAHDNWSFKLNPEMMHESS